MKPTATFALYVTMFAASSGLIPVAGQAESDSATSIQYDVQAEISRPWAMSFLPDGRLLVTEKAGRLLLLDLSRKTTVVVSGVPAISYGGQGGLGDIILHPDFSNNQTIYLSYVEQDSDGKRGATVARAVLDSSDPAKPRLEILEAIWRQHPRVAGGAHFGMRLAFDSDGHLFVTSGERRRYEVAQRLDGNLGRILRLTDTGQPAPGNPFAAQGAIASQAWTLGNRNPLGIAFDPAGRLWAHEMGPAGGDELNLIRRGANYGYPRVSDGDHYNGRDIPDHETSDLYQRPANSWNPVISPAGLVFYTGKLFKSWQGNALIGGLSSRALIRVAIEGDNAREVERIPLGVRIREVEQGPDGALWLLTDGPNGELWRVTPKP